MNENEPTMTAEHVLAIDWQSSLMEAPVKLLLTEDEVYKLHSVLGKAMICLEFGFPEEQQPIVGVGKVFSKSEPQKDGNEVGPTLTVRAVNSVYQEDMAYGHKEFIEVELASSSESDRGSIVVRVNSLTSIWGLGDVFGLTRIARGSATIKDRNPLGEPE